MVRSVVCLLIAMCIGSRADAQFAPIAGQPGSTAMHVDSSCFVSWAISCQVQRGFVNISDPTFEYDGSVYASYGTDSVAVGKPNGQIVSLGDGGVALLEFNPPIANGESWDFAVFENALNDVFLELAFVEVSSDGVNFFRFPAVSLTPTDIQTASFGNTNAEKINNLAGKYRAPYGTPFDLSELPDSPNLDKYNVRFVRLIDVVGSIHPDYATYDSQGNIVNDPWPTAFHSGGFDLDGVGVINNSLNTSIKENLNMKVALYPNPTRDVLNITSSENIIQCRILLMDGREIYNEMPFSNSFSISLSFLPNSSYLVVLVSEMHSKTYKILKW